MTNNAQKSLKLILVGPSSVGKTSLVSAFFNQQFESQTIPTVAPAFCSAIVKDPNDSEIELQIWDTAGQEQYQAISQMFYRDSQVCFACYDMESEPLITSWVETVKIQAPDCIIILVTTKADLLKPDQLDKVRLSGKNLCKELGAMGHYITSANTGQNIPDIFKVAASCYDQIFQISGPKVNIEAPKSKDDGCKC